jgi:hypothetical protein
MDYPITTDILLRGAVIFILLDLVLVPLLNRWVKAETFRRLKWLLPLVCGVFYAVLWGVVMNYYWDTIYSFVFPAWIRGIMPFFQGGLAAAAALLAGWIARKSRLPTLIFLLLGGVYGILTHTWAVHMGIVTNPPPLQGASPYAAVLIACFEFMFYWCLILALAALISWAASHHKK